MDLFKEYAQNRIDLRNIKKEIMNLLPDFEESMSGIEIDLQPYREEYFDEYGADNTDWNGWVVALKESESEYTKPEMDLAILLDKKKKIIFECGKIRRLIYCEGIKRINAKPLQTLTCQIKPEECTSHKNGACMVHMGDCSGKTEKP